MSTFEMLLSMPAVPAVMAALLDKPEGIDEASLTIPAGGPGRLEDTLSALARRGLIVRRSGLVFLTPGSGAIEKARKIVGAFYDLKSLMETSFMVRGVLGATEYYRCLVHRDTMFDMLAEEGVEKERLEKVLAAEERQGYVENLDIAYRVRGGVKEKFFPFIPHHHYHDFVFMHSRTVQKVGASSREPVVDIVEERYLLGSHPESIAQQARMYMKQHKHHILSRVRNEAFDIIWWYDRY